MATFGFSGLETLGSQLESFADDLDEVTDQMLIEGGKIITEEWKTAAELAGHRDMSHGGKHMIDAIAPTKPKKDKYGYPYVSVFPQGKYTDRRDKHGQPISFAKVAAILNYGRSDLEGSNFMKKAEARAAQRLDKLQQQTMDDFMKQKGLT